MKVSSVSANQFLPSNVQKLPCKHNRQEGPYTEMKFWAAEASISAPFFLFYLISALCLACSVCEVAYLIPL